MVGRAITDPAATPEPDVRFFARPLGLLTYGGSVAWGAAYRAARWAAALKEIRII